MAKLFDAVPMIVQTTGRKPTLVGGLAVVCRLSRPHRATSDLDSVQRRHGEDANHLQLLIAGGATESGPAGVLIPTESGEVQVDVIVVSDADLEPLPEEPTGRLHAMSHAWAHETATAVEIRVVQGALTLNVAEPGPIVAMKLQSMMDRGSAKQATDLLDIISIVLDPTAGRTALAQLAAANQTLRDDCNSHVDFWFRKNKLSCYQLLQTLPAGKAYELDDMDLVAEYLQVVTASSVVTADRRYQVFLSSTFSDLVDVRQAVVQQILKMDRYIPAGMELFSASPQPPWNVITSALAGTDYMVLILGTRYGSIVPGEGISYTEKEYNYALEHEIPVLAFIGAEDRMVPANTAETSAHRKLLKKFRDRVAGSSTIEYWSTDTDLPAKVITALTKAVQTTPRPGWIRGGPGGITAAGRIDPSAPSAQTAPKLPDPQLKEPPASAIDNIKDWIRDPTKSVRIEELILDQTKDLVLKVQGTSIVLQDGETLYGRYQELLDLSLPLIELATTAIRYDQTNDYAELWPKVAKKLLTGRSKVPSGQPYQPNAERSRSLPALYFVRCAGMALLENNAETAFIQLLTEPTFREPEYNRVVDALIELQDYELLDRNEINSHSPGSGWMYPPSHHLRQVLRDAMQEILPEDEDYQLAQNRFEHRRAFIEFSEYDYVTPGEFIGERSMMTNDDASDQLAFEKSAARPDSLWRKYFTVPDDLENSLQKFQDRLGASRRGL